MQYRELADFLNNVGKDPARLIFEDELTGIHNRRYFLSYLEHRIRWDSQKDYPLSLLIIDVDHFKKINDTHGHDAGDQVLQWMAGHLREVAGDDAVPVRYGGDEFVMLVPGIDRTSAGQLGEKLLKRIRDESCELDDGETKISLTLSVGVASAPEDAQDRRGLIQQADTALYHAKRSGRNRVSKAGEFDQQKVFSKTALYRMEGARIAGRKAELTVVSEGLEGLAAKKSQFLILEGAPGMGKSTLLESVRGGLAEKDTFRLVKVSGVRQEGYRPYYLAARTVMSILDQLEGKGVKHLDSLEKEELRLLGRVLPRLVEVEEEEGTGEDESKLRHKIFYALVEFLTRLLESSPLILLIDDLHFSDEATLHLLRVLIERREITVFICGTSMEKLTKEDEDAPLQRFLSMHEKKLAIHRVSLQPIGAKDIARHLQAVFPGMSLPAGLEDELARVTQGNPFFLSEIIRKLVMDQKVALVGQQWSLKPLEDGYLPDSLQEIVAEKIVALDEESRELLEHASTMGENVPVSVLAGSTELEESKILEFLGRAEAMGLISMDFELNDETMRFLSKRVLEISYGAIEKERREELHERVGSYQEELFQKRLLPSASVLAYHFKHSANQEKAQRYERIQMAYSQRVFDTEEAAGYAGELIDEEPEIETDHYLAAQSLRLIPNVLRTFLTAARNTQLYPPESQAIIQSQAKVKNSIEAIFFDNDFLELSHSQHTLLANGQKLDVSEYRLLAESFLDLMARSELQIVAFQPGITDEELIVVIDSLGQTRQETIGPGFWKKFSADNELTHVRLEQMRYSAVRAKRRNARRADAGASGTSASRPTLAAEEKLEQEELAEVPRILRPLLGAAKNIKLYPLGSQPVSSVVEQLHDSLRVVLSKKPVLTLAGAEQSVFVNGEKIVTSDYEDLAGNFLKFMGSVELASLTFLESISRNELETFIEELRDHPKPGTNGAYWVDFTQERGLVGLVLNERRYKSSLLEVLIDSAEGGAGPEGDGGPLDEDDERISKESLEALRDAVPTLGKELLVKGEDDLVRKMLRRLFEDYHLRDTPTRESVVKSCRSLLNDLILALQLQLSKISADFLLDALRVEKDPKVLGELADMLHRMSASAVQFADYPLASRLLFGLKTRRQQLEEVDSEQAGLLERKLESAAAQLLSDDLRSGDPQRQETAAQLLQSLGRAGVPLLVDVVKQEKDYRIRHIAATLLADMGWEAEKQLKRELILEVTAEQRFRILEVIDAVTHNLKTELAYCLGDVNPRVRRAAFQLAERLNDNSVNELLIDFARNEDMAVAKAAIRCLANSRSAAMVDALISILKTATEPERAIACSQALGQLGDPACIEALSRILTEKKMLVFSRRWNDQVRATAAFALGQISNPRAKEVLARCKNDPDPRIREIARSAAGE
jgi:diguanylate cyclase (GGDEF)-like protein